MGKLLVGEPIEHPFSTTQSNLVFNPGKKRNPKIHPSKIHILNKELDDNPKRGERTQEQAILDGMWTIMKEIEEIKGQIYDMKTNATNALKDENL